MKTINGIELNPYDKFKSATITIRKTVYNAVNIRIMPSGKCIGFYALHDNGKKSGEHREYIFEVTIEDIVK